MKKGVGYLLGFLLALSFFGSKSFAFSLKTEKVKLIKEPVHIYLPAVVVSKTAVTVSSKIPGFIENLNVDLGYKVKKGDILLTIDQNVSKQNIKQAVANVEKAKSRLKNAKFNYEKYLTLYKNKVVSKQQLINMTTNYKTALGAYQQALAALKMAESTLKYSVIKSPVNGIVSEKYVNNGDMASMFQPLLKISPTNALQVMADIDQATLKLVWNLKYADVTVKIENKTLPLKITNISPALDPITKTETIKIDLPKTLKAMPGEFAYVIFSTKTHPTVVVNKKAVTTRGGIKGVFVVGKKGKISFRMVRCGRIYKGYIEILSGLFPKETVVIDPPLSLKNGSVIINEKR